MTGNDRIALAPVRPTPGLLVLAFSRVRLGTPGNFRSSTRAYARIMGSYGDAKDSLRSGSNFRSNTHAPPRASWGLSNREFYTTSRRERGYGVGEARTPAPDWNVGQRSGCHEALRLKSVSFKARARRNRKGAKGAPFR